MNDMKKNKQLTLKQEQFCQYYVDTGNASAAYRMAYSTEKMKNETIWSEASRLLADHMVSARISEIRKENDERSKVSRERVEKILVNIVEADTSDLYKWDERKGTFILKSPHELPQRIRTSLKKICNKRGELTYELNGKVEAARLLASMNGWEAAKEVKVSGGGVPVQSDIRIGFDDED